MWPHVLGLRPIQLVVVRDPEGRWDDSYLFTTDLAAECAWVIGQLAWRWAIAVLCRASTQVLEIEAPQHWCQARVEKVAPWVWSLQRGIMVWYLRAGYASAAAAAWRPLLGEWDSAWSLRHRLQVLRVTILDSTINPNSADAAQLREMIQTLKNWPFLAT